MLLLIVNPFDPIPGERMRPGRYLTIAEMFAEKGWDVEWLTASFSHSLKSGRTESTRDLAGRKIHVLPVPVIPYSRHVSVMRIMSHLRYALSVSQQLSRCEPDCIIVSSPPIFASAVVVSFARRHQIPVIVDVQDAWPETFLRAAPPLARPLAQLALGWLKSLRNWSATEAQALTAVSSDYLDLIPNNPCQMRETIHLGYSSLNDDTDSPIDEQGILTCAYVGSVSSAYDLDTAISAMSGMRGVANLVIAGDGPDISRLQKRVDKEGLDNIRFTGWMDYQELMAMLRRVDVGLNLVKKESCIYFPNKVFDYLRAGCVITNPIYGELSGLLANAGAGLQYVHGDPASLTLALRFLAYLKSKGILYTMRTSARLLSREFTRECEYLAFVEMADQLTGAIRAEHNF